MNVAGRTGADAAAIAVNARHAVEERRFARCFAFGYLDLPPRSITGNERHFDHHKLRILVQPISERAAAPAVS